MTTAYVTPRERMEAAAAQVAEKYPALLRDPGAKEFIDWLLAKFDPLDLRATDDTSLAMRVGERNVVKYLERAWRLANRKAKDT